MLIHMVITMAVPTSKYQVVLKSAIPPDSRAASAKPVVTAFFLPPVKRFTLPAIRTTMKAVFMSMDPKSLMVCARISSVKVSWPSNATSTRNTDLRISFTTTTAITARVDITCTSPYSSKNPWHRVSFLPVYGSANSTSSASAGE